jgi:hypothetical protein
MRMRPRRNPTRFSGCTLWLNGGAVKENSAAGFVVANAMLLSVADNATLSAGDVNLHLAAWVFNTSNPGVAETRTLAGKWKGLLGDDLEYRLFLDNTAGTIRFKFSVRNVADDTTTTVTAGTFGTPSTSTWYLLEAYHDADNNVIGISVNAGTRDTEATTGGVRDGTAPFALGADFTGVADAAANHYGGRMDSVAVWKKVLTATESGYVYNAGAGLGYGDLNGTNISLRTSLVAWWDFQELAAATNPVDRVNSITLTNTNAVFRPASNIFANALSGDAVGRWHDLSTAGLHATQGTSALRPSFTTSSSFKPGRAALSFDGTNDQLLVDALATLLTGDDTPFSVLAVIVPTSVSGNRTVLGLGNASEGNTFVSLDNATTTQRFVRRDSAATAAESTITAGAAANVIQLASAVFYGTTVDVVLNGLTGNIGAALNVPSLTLTQASIGASPRNTSSNFWSGDIFEVIVFSRAITLRERKTIERTLAVRYKIPAGLIK